MRGKTKISGCNERIRRSKQRLEMYEQNELMPPTEWWKQNIDSILINERRRLADLEQELSVLKLNKSFVK